MVEYDRCANKNLKSPYVPKNLVPSVIMTSKKNLAKQRQRSRQIAIDKCSCQL